MLMNNSSYGKDVGGDRNDGRTGSCERDGGCGRNNTCARDNGCGRNNACGRTGNCPSDKKSLFDAIGSVSFTMDELRLYLDTHPNCKKALELFGDYADKRAELIEVYTKKYGPICAYDVDTACGWSWIDEPMPWN